MNIYRLISYNTAGFASKSGDVVVKYYKTQDAAKAAAEAIAESQTGERSEGPILRWIPWPDIKGTIASVDNPLGEFYIATLEVED
jgi:hypothetical protein